jgi:hypothetical protein
LFWWKRAEVKRSLDEHPGSSWGDEWTEEWGEEDHIPRECILYPERVIEYPPEFGSRDGPERWLMDRTPEIREAFDVARKIRIEGFESPWGY